MIPSEAREIMRFRLVLIGLSAFWALTGCAAALPAASMRCDVTSLGSVAENPMRYAGRVFCGRVIVRRFYRTIRILQTETEEPNDDLALILAEDDQRHFGDIDNRPRTMEIRATIEPQRDCFAPELNEGRDRSERCVPFLRPVFFYVIRQSRESRPGQLMSPWQDLANTRAARASASATTPRVR